MREIFYLKVGGSACWEVCVYCVVCVRAGMYVASKTKKSKTCIEHFYARLPISMATSKMAAVTITTLKVMDILS